MPVGGVCAERGGGSLSRRATWAKFPAGIAGITAGESVSRISSGSSVRYGGTSYAERGGFELMELDYPSSASVTAVCGETAAVVELASRDVGGSLSPRAGSAFQAARLTEGPRTQRDRGASRETVPASRTRARLVWTISLRVKHSLMPVRG